MVVGGRAEQWLRPLMIDAGTERASGRVCAGGGGQRSDDGR